jgi:hypothetical protein
MGELSEIHAEGKCPVREGRDCPAAVAFSEPRRLRDGSIDYDFYKARTRRLRHRFQVEVKWLAARQVLRGLIMLGQWIVRRAASERRRRGGGGDTPNRAASERVRTQGRTATLPNVLRALPTPFC